MFQIIPVRIILHPYLIVPDRQVKITVILLAETGTGIAELFTNLNRHYDGVSAKVLSYLLFATCFVDSTGLSEVTTSPLFRYFETYSAQFGP